jgi:hypothetical protein
MEGGLSTMFASKLKLTAMILGASGCLALGAWALGQSLRGKTTGDGGAQAEAPKGPLSEQALRDSLEKPLALKLADARLRDVLKAIKKETENAETSGVPIYVEPAGLEEAGATIDSRISIDATGVSLETALDRALRPAKLAATVRDGLLVVTSRQEAALIELRALNAHLGKSVQHTDGAAAQRGSGGSSPSSWLKQLQGRTTYSPESDDEARPKEDAKTRAIVAALEEPIDMQFPNETPLEDVLKYIKSATEGPGLPSGLPIYVDPVGLQEAEKTMTSPVTLDLNGVPVRQTLRLILKQLGLTYMVKDGLLSITSESSEDVAPTPILILAGKATRGDLSLSEMHDLIELFEARAKVMRYAEGKADGGAPAHPTSSTTADELKTKQIEDALETIVPMHVNALPLAKVVEEVKKATAGREGLPEGIPIYKNPSAVNALEIRGVPVTIDLDGAKLKTSLRLMLGQLGLAYTVKDGLLIIDKADSPELDPPSARSRVAGPAH